MEIKVKQGSDEWLEKRHNLITATNVASLLGFNNVNSHIELLKNKVMPIKEQISKTNLFKIWGTKFEEYARSVYELKSKKFRVPGLYIHNEYKWLGATPDGISGNELLEIKCPIYKISTECPPNYYAQIQIQLEVTNKETCKLFQCLFKFYYDKEEYDIEDGRIKGDIELDGVEHYWYLEESLEINIKRDREWFKKHYPRIKNFKDIVDEFKEGGYDNLIDKINRNNYIKDGNKKQKTSINLVYFHDINDFYNSTKKTYNPLIDYLDYYGSDKYINEEDIRLVNNKNISWYVKRERTKFKNNFLESIETIELKSERCIYDVSKINIFYDLFKKTYWAIKKGDKIILNSLFIANNNIILKPDILIHTKELNRLFDKDYTDNFYNVIDFKLSISDENYNDINFLKVKSYIYKLLGFRYFILIKSIKIIEIHNDDTFYKPTLEWINKMKINGFKWSLNKLHIWQLFPNMKDDGDIIWSKCRKKLAVEVKDLSLLWYCIGKYRVEYLKQNITSWDNEKIDLKKLIFRNYKLVNKMITNEELIYYEHIPKFRKRKKYFVDYESTNSLSTNRYNFNGNMVYLIGVGWDEDDEWKFKYFLANDLSKEEEVRIFKEFMDFIGRNYLIFHWAYHEQNEFKRVYEKNKDIFKFEKENWIDLCRVFQECDILVKGVFSFKLKQVASKLFEYGLINTEWDKNSVDGQYALVYPLLMTETNNKLIKDFTMNKIIKYNEIDCKVMWEMMKLLKSLEK